LTKIFTYFIILIQFICSAQTNKNIIYIQNSEIKLGVNLDHGGAISYLTETASAENMINNSDWGRKVQMPIYTNPKAYIPESGKQIQESWAFFGWNPIQSGYVGVFKSKLVDYYQGKDSIYIKSIPMQWPLSNVPGECFFESSIKIKGNIVQVNNRIINNQIDKTQYPIPSQELPAVYVNAAYHRLVTYKGDKPFKNDTVSEIPQNSKTEPKWNPCQATENWVAHLNDNDFGLGIYTAEVPSYIGDFYGKKDAGGTKDGPTDYGVPILKEVLDDNIVYDYSYNLCVGTLQDIRNMSTKNRTPLSQLKHNFKNDRDHIHYEGSNDKDFPVNDKLITEPQKRNTSIKSTNISYTIRKNFNFYMNAMFPVNTKQVSLICSSHANMDEMIYNLPVQADNKFHRYQIHLKNKSEKDYTTSQLKIKVAFENVDKNTQVQIKEFGIE